MPTKKFIWPVAAMLCIVVGGCSSPKPKQPAGRERVLISRSTMLKIAESKGGRSARDQRMHSALLELREQYRANGNTFVMPDSIREREAFVQPSLASIRGSDSLFCYVRTDITLDSTSFDSVATLVAQKFAKVVAANKPARLIEAWFPITKIDSVANFSMVEQISLATEPIRSEAPDPKLVLRVPSAISFPEALDHAGEGVTVGVISDDCGSTDEIDPSTHRTYLEASRAAGKIGPTDGPVAPGYDNSSVRTHEGLAMMELVHQMAKGASVKFATGIGPDGGGIATYIDHMRALANTSQIVVDDILYPDEPAFEDGQIARAMEDIVRTQHTIFISAAGNLSRNVYSFRFTPSELPESFGKALSWRSAIVHNNAGNDYKQLLDLQPGHSLDVMLQWDDPYGGSENDFDLYLIDVRSGSILSASTNDQFRGGGCNPYERLSYTYTPCWGQDGYKLVIARHSASSNPTPRMKLMIRGSMHEASDPIRDSSIFGHPAAPNVLACAAVNVMYPWVAQDYSSRGPVPIVSVGTPTAADGSRPINELRMKPDIAALDNVSTFVPTFDPFSGTSAAAPIAAGLAARVLSDGMPIASGFDLDTLRKILRATSNNFVSTLSDWACGYGRVDGLQASTAWREYRSHAYAAAFNPPKLSSAVSSAAAGGVIAIGSDAASGKTQFYVSASLSNCSGAGPLDIMLSNGSTTYHLAHLPASNGVQNPDLVFSNSAASELAVRSPSTGCYKPSSGTVLPSTPSAMATTWHLQVSSGSGSPVVVRRWGIVLH